MAAFYLRVEGVNFDASLFDTQDLTTIRGSGLLLLRAIHAIDHELERSLPSGYRVETLSTGASVGFWRIEGKGANPDDIRARCAAWLEGGKLGLPTEHLTFVVDALPASEPGAYLADRERILALNRWRQMTSPTVVYPRQPPADDVGDGADDSPDPAPVCMLDLVRPTLRRPEGIKGEQRRVSASVSGRRRFGLREKQRFYRRELADAGRYPLPSALSGDEMHPFPFHFASVAEWDRPRNLRRNLRDKIAVLYADGNGVSALQTRVIKGETGTALGKDPIKRQRAFDTLSKDHWRDYLHRLLCTLWAAEAHGRPHPEEVEERKGRFQAEDVLRIETLLWGGDEVMFVLPARLGWRAAQLLLDAEAGANEAAVMVDGNQVEAGKGWLVGETRLSHAIGLVFCHHDAPIDRVSNLAKTLAEKAKGVSRERSLLYPMVLESFDHVGTGLDRYWSLRCPRGLDPAGLALSRDAMRAVSAAAQSMAPTFPRRRIKGIGMALQSGGALGDAFKKRLDDAQTTHPALKEWTRDATGVIGEPAFWYHLEDLWDYLVPELREAVDDHDAIPPAA